MLSVRNLTYRYDQEFTIKDVSFDLARGETLAMVGPSGSGKTTLLKLILGAFQIDTGSILLDGKDITYWEIDKRNIGYCPQDQLLFPHLNVFNNIAIGLKALKLPKNTIETTVNELATKGGISSYLKRKPNQLSGGQKQRVSILRALAPAPSILLLDEPFHNLDAQIKDQIVQYIKKLQSETNVAIIFVTHDISEARLLADKILILVNGVMRQVGTPKELSYNPNSVEVARSMGLPNIYKILDYKVDEKTLELPFGYVFLNQQEYTNHQMLLIDPSLIKILDTDNKQRNTFQGSIKTVTFDVLTKTQIYFVQIETSKNIQEKESIIQIVESNVLKERKNNEKIIFEITNESIKLL